MAKKYIKTEYFDMDGNLLTDEAVKREELLPAKDRWFDRTEKLREEGVKAKPEHYAMGTTECARRACYCETRHLRSYKHDIKYNMYYEKEDGTTVVESVENYKAETWRKIFVFRNAAEYWSCIARQVMRKEELEKPMHMHVEHKDIIITDPCYIAKDWSEFYDKYTTRPVSRLNVPPDERCVEDNIMMRDTLYGDWSCHVFNEKEEPIGQFCADAGMVCVAALDGSNPDIDPLKVQEIAAKDWCATILKDYTGDIYIKRISHGEDSFDDEIIVEGVGSVNFTTRQTGL
jgi:hypothetical protein